MPKFGQRRRVIKLLAAGTIAGVLAGAAATSLPHAVMAQGGTRHKPRLHHWQGFALGAEVSLQLYHSDEAQAQRIIAGSVAILRDMEALFSLYGPQSTLSKLNRSGAVNQPPRAFVELLRFSNKISHLTSGAFDVTVQPLWQYYNSLFSTEKTPGPHDLAALQKVRALIGFEKLSVTDVRVAFDQPNMAATLNGIAQGFVTDRVSDYLKAEGLTSVLVDMGEYRALGPQADGTPWRIGLADPDHLGQLAEILEINQGAVATSSGTDDRFDDIGEYHHLFDPTNGRSAHRYSSVTVTAPIATLADALSTAFCAMSVADITQCLKRVSDVTARLTKHDGTVVRL